jgi:nitrogen fixation/metabolism regulation signal transduction histidine kinase
MWLNKLKFREGRFLFIIGAISIAFFSLLVSHYLVKDLSEEERNKVKIWSEALKTINNADADTDLTLVLSVLNSNNTIPVIVFDNEGEVQTFRNITITPKDSLKQLQKISQVYQSYKDKHIRINLTVDPQKKSKDDFIDIYYDDSLLLKRLAYYPYVQLLVVVIFVFIAIFALLSAKKAEQNKVWVGLSKETAHQLGTPISSLMAWMEILRSKYSSDKLLDEMNNDVNRLRLIADRFSKIGSMPRPETYDLEKVIENAVTYMKKRTSKKVKYTLQLPEEKLKVALNLSLFEWVIENLCKNAIDAMNGQGEITINVFTNVNRIYIEFTDTGKGVSKSNYKRIFKPGFTTKKRGWGLGLSLAKRIVEEYHTGKIYVKSSEPNKGTTFRIELNSSK